MRRTGVFSLQSNRREALGLMNALWKSAKELQRQLPDRVLAPRAGTGEGRGPTL